MKISRPVLRWFLARVARLDPRNCRLSLKTSYLPRERVRYFSIPWPITRISTPSKTLRAIVMKWESYPPEVVEEDGDYAGAAEAQVAPFVRSAQVLPRDVLMVADLVRVVCVEGVVADVASSLLVVHVSNALIPLETLLFVVEADCHRL